MGHRCKSTDTIEVTQLLCPNHHEELLHLCRHASSAVMDSHEHMRSGEIYRPARAM